MANIPYPEQYDDSFINIFKRIIDELNSMGYTYDQVMDMAQDILNEAQQVNTENTKTNERLDTIILESGTSDAEVVDARGNYSLLKDRLNAISTEATNKADRKFVSNQIDFVKLLQENNEVASSLFVKKKSDRTFDVLIPYRGERYAHYEFKKDGNDDFIKMGDIKVTSKGNPSTTFSNYDSMNGSFNTNGAPNYYANPGAEGATLTLNFTGTGIDFQHRADGNGGVWEFVVDGDTANAVQVSTHINASPSSFSVKEVFRGLEDVPHELVATFIGDDPENPPDSGSSRGWFSVNEGSDAERETFIVYGYTDELAPEFTVNTGSNKEFAFGHSISTDGGTTWEDSYWLPEHNGVGTAFLGEQRVYFDGKEINDWSADSDWVEVKSIRIIQKLDGIHPSEPSSPSASINEVTTISAKGVGVQAKIKALKPLKIEGGHVLMLVADNTFADQLITSYGKRYDATDTDGRIDLDEDDQSMSYAFINTSGTQAEQDTMLAMRVNNIANTFRWGQPNRKPDGMVWLQHRSSLQKLYPHVMRDHYMDVGEEYELSGMYFLGEYPMAGNLLPDE